MYDTERRVALVKQRVRENTRRRQRHEAISLSAACMLLFAVLMQAADALIAPGQTAAWGSFGAMLLREDAGGYVLVAVVSFAAAASHRTHLVRRSAPARRLCSPSASAPRTAAYTRRTVRRSRAAASGGRTRASAF